MAISAPSSTLPIPRQYSPFYLPLDFNGTPTDAGAKEWAVKNPDKPTISPARLVAYGLEGFGAIVTLSSEKLGSWLFGGTALAVGVVTHVLSFLQAPNLKTPVQADAAIPGAQPVEVKPGVKGETTEDPTRTKSTTSREKSTSSEISKLIQLLNRTKIIKSKDLDIRDLTTKRKNAVTELKNLISDKTENRIIDAFAGVLIRTEGIKNETENEQVRFHVLETIAEIYKHSTNEITRDAIKRAIIERIRFKGENSSKLTSLDLKELLELKRVLEIIIKEQEKLLETVNKLIELVEKKTT